LVFVVDLVFDEGVVLAGWKEVETVTEAALIDDGV
jgi:hypothetical protein